MEKYKAAIQSLQNLIMVGFLIKPDLNWSSDASWSCIFQGRMQISDFCTQRATWAQPPAGDAGVEWWLVSPVCAVLTRLPMS